MNHPNLRIYNIKVHIHVKENQCYQDDLVQKSVNLRVLYEHHRGDRGLI
jgi:hypothetical protein